MPQRTEFLSGVQRGNRVILNWPAPRRNASDDSVQSIRRIDVYRLAEPVNAPRGLTEERFSARATLIGSVGYEQIRAATDELSFEDTLSLSEPVRLRYAVRYVNAAGQRAAFSNFLLVEPAPRISQPPNISSAPLVSQTAVTLRWEAPAANIDGSTPPNILGYNVYRADRSQTETAQTPINRALVTTTEYADQTFQFGEEYVYVVRAVSLGQGDTPQVESLNSNAVTVAPRDIFPPAAPAALSIAVALGRISVFFAANPERDVAGYNLYRSTDPSLPKTQWTKLNRALLERTTFQDETVETGTRYYYFLTAVDTAGNVSPASEVVSEVAP
ncbi:MAG TPA: hypothetical protein VGV38_17790 [Pyrinomonadaceae bacterium]|nr:hypothetical protein [Pyrinomonadaceae bacterium]